jgi:isopenicillin-N epimerase
MQSIREQFDLDPELIYLNSGSISIPPRSVMDALARINHETHLNPTEALFGAWSRLWRVQERLARFLGAHPQNLFLRNNVTSAMNAFLLGSRAAQFRSGGELLLSELEYGAVANIARFRAEREGMSVRVFSLPCSRRELQGLTPSRVVEKIVYELRPESRVLVLSHVMTANGLTLPLRELARETRARGVLLVIDGAHAPGALRLDFSELEDVDFYGGNLHKWMMCAQGTGFGWMPDRHRESLEPIETGWMTFATPPAFQGFGGGDRACARMLLSSSQNFAAWFAIEEGLQFWECLGFERILEHRRKLRLAFEHAFDAPSGLEKLSPEEGELRGPLITYRLADAHAAEGYALMQRLVRDEKLQVVTNVIRDRFCLRVSPALHNTLDEMERAAQILLRVLKDQ